MELLNKLTILASKIRQQGDAIQTEEATKNAFIMPFLSQVLGYDVFDPSEVVPEFVCDLGTKKGEKIDYAIFRNGGVQIVVECKKFGEPLNVQHASQLFRYFHVTNARIALLTNGAQYLFFTDLDAPNKMDEKPFLVLDLLNIDESTAPELAKLSKDQFDLDAVISTAGELKYVGQLKRELAAEFASPSDDFVRFLAGRVYDGKITASVREQFQSLTQKATAQFLSDQVNDRLKSAMSPPASVSQSAPQAMQPVAIEQSQPDADQKKDLVDTTDIEFEGYYLIKSICRKLVDPKRISFRDNQSYLAVLLDDN
ncbi:type I restriction endonuclease, partial [Flavobacterium sp.]|uniref:type I restriction endonuclease n=1 Tax=Flavobacterium sp. TaxID=239 RepID=UPI0037BF5B36